MRLSIEYLTALDDAYQKGFQQGLELAAQMNERQMMIGYFFIIRFGEIDQQLNAIITPLSEMPHSESIRLLKELNREQLIERFTSDN